MESQAASIARQLGREAEAVCRYYLSNGRRQGRYWIVGDVENNHGRSLYVRLEGPASGPGAAGKWADAATGEHGDMLDLIAANQRLASVGQALDEARRFLGIARPAPRLPTTPRGSAEAARRLFAAGRPVAGTLAEAYLRSRGILCIPGASALRFHPRCYYWRDDRPGARKPESWPALLAGVSDLEGHLRGLHRTWLDPSGARKAPVEEPRKAMGELLGHGVRFGVPTDLLAAGEGLETMLSLRLALPALPVVAALSASHVAALLLPAGLARLYIAVDADEAGAAAGARLAERALKQAVEPVTLMPRCGDFNEDLLAFGTAELRAQLRPQLAPADVERLLQAH